MATDSQRVVVASVAEADIGSIKVGDPVALTFNAYPGKIYTGTVTGLPLMATTSSNVTTYPVNVTVNGPAQELLPGMTASLTIVTARAQNVTVVPTTAVQTTSFGSYVVALNSHNQIVRLPVQTGISDLNNTQILSGLTPGQRIVVPRVSSLASAGGATGGRRGFGGLGGFGGGRVRGGG
jgi:multidrug efflux pump subunit AcrA (membrane-fusion protein)